MGRSTVYNNITTEESLEKILPENKQLCIDFLEYLKSIDRSVNTIAQYKSDLKIFFVWNLERNGNKRFVDITKREFSRFQSCTLDEWKWSSNRIRRVKSTISSLSNFVENILDDEPGFENYKSVIRKIESPVNELVRDKTVFTKDELQRLLDYLVDNQQYEKACVVSLAMNSGRRKSELTRFKVSHFADENVKFGSLYKTNEKIKTKGRGKGKFIELYVFKKDFDPYLKLWLNYRKENNIESEWLFPQKGNSDRHIEGETLNNWTESFSKILGKPFYFHSLRHYFTTECLRNNLPEAVVQEIVSWSSADMVHLYDDRDADDTLAMYFDENGIKSMDQKSLSDL